MIHERNSRQPSQPPPGWKITLIFLAGALALIGVVLLVLNYIYTHPELPAQTKLGLVFLLLFIVLGFSVGGISYVMHTGLGKTRIGPVWVALILAYGLPLVIYLGLSRAVFASPGPLPDALQRFMVFSDYFPGQPWMFIWQAIVLAFFSRPSGERLASKDAGLGLPDVPASLLSGIFIGLVAVFAYSIGSGLIENSSTGQLLSQTIDIPLPVRITTLAVALVIAPWAEERFFRLDLLGRVQARLGKWPAFLGVSALYAILQFRPLVWAPAFLAGLGFSILAERTGRLRPVVIAHAVVNVILFLLGWYLVI
jgi:hypothetical protein